MRGVDINLIGMSELTVSRGRERPDVSVIALLLHAIIPLYKGFTEYTLCTVLIVV